MTSAVRRYRPSRPWPVSALALVAATGAVLTTGALSSALDGGPDPAFASGIRQSVASAQPGLEAHAASPTVMTPAARPSGPPSSGAWQVQAGAFRSEVAAEAHLRALEGEMPELAGLAASRRLRGGLTRIRIGMIEDESAARQLCARIRAAGRGCFVVRPES